MVGDRIKVLRESMGLSQLDLAKAINIAQSSIGNYERGIRIPDADTIISLSNYFDVSADYLLGLTKDRKRYPTAADSLGLSYEATEQLVAWKERYPDGDIGLQVLSRLIRHSSFFQALVDTNLLFELSKTMYISPNRSKRSELCKELEKDGYYPIELSKLQMTILPTVKDEIGEAILNISKQIERRAAIEYLKEHDIDPEVRVVDTSKDLSEYLQDE